MTTQEKIEFSLVCLKHNKIIGDESRYYACLRKLNDIVFLVLVSWQGNEEFIVIRSGATMAEIAKEITYKTTLAYLVHKEL